jgi:predicted porin
VRAAQQDRAIPEQQGHRFIARSVVLFYEPSWRLLEMKKALRVGGITVLAGAASLACAQAPSGSNVTLYGLIDLGVEHSDVGSQSVTRLSSGISTGSRWGVRGQEDLGNGWKALFTLESRVEADNGTMQNNGSVYNCGTPANCPGVVLGAPYTSLPSGTQATLLGAASQANASLLALATNVNSANALFDRQAYVGLVTPVGAFLFGRQYTPGYEVLVKFNAMTEGFAGSSAQLSQTTIRSNNAVQYRVEAAGFTGSAMYSFGGSEINRNERGTSPSNGDDMWGVNLQYDAPAFGVGVGYNRNNTVTVADSTHSRKGLETLGLGGSATVGPVKLFGSFLRARNDNPVLTPDGLLGLLANNVNPNTLLPNYYVGRGDVDGLRGVIGPVRLKVYHLGAQWTVPTGTVQFSYARAKDNARSLWATADAKVDQFGLAYLHKLSLRTQLYAAAAVAANKGEARVALGGAGYLGGLTTGQGTDNRVVQLGVRHAF